MKIIWTPVILAFFACFCSSSASGEATRFAFLEETGDARLLASSGAMSASPYASSALSVNPAALSWNTAAKFSQIGYETNSFSEKRFQLLVAKTLNTKQTTGFRFHYADLGTFNEVDENNVASGGVLKPYQSIATFYFASDHPNNWSWGISSHSIWEKLSPALDSRLA